MSKTTFEYVGENEKKYQIIFEVTNDNVLILTIIDLKDGDLFISNYFLNNLNDKFGNTIKLKTLKDFESCCIENINKKLLILKPPYRNIINSVWKVFPNNKSNSQTFTLISMKSYNKKISVYNYYNYPKIKDIVEQIQKQLLIEIQKSSLMIEDENMDLLSFKDNWILDKIYCLKGNYSKMEDKENDFIKLLKSEQTDSGFRKLLIFFDEENILNFMIKLVKQFYANQFFILFFTKKNVEEFRTEINSKLSRLNEIFLSYFDTNNIFIYQDSKLGYEESIISLVKVYTYFNQLGDGFYKQLAAKNYKIKGLDNILKPFFLTHYFNILLYGRTGTGKSSFINKFMGEKKSFTLKTRSIGTERNNFYIHKKYPIKLLDVCGFAEGNETQENLAKIKSIYEKGTSNILIDEPMNDAFTFYGDKRNNIHLLIYFNIYEDRYDIFPGELPFILDIKGKDIPIMFVVNKCPEKIFSDQEVRQIVIDEIQTARNDTDFKDYETFFINCINGKGFEALLKGIYSKYEKNIIKDSDLLKIKDYSMPIDKFNNLFNNTFFFGKFSPEDVFLNESLLESVIDIKNLIVKLAGYYSGNLGFLDSLSFLFFKRLYNQFFRDSNKNFFPLLTNLVKKIYSNFGYTKTEEQCNNYIRHKLSQYFNLHIQDIGKRSGGGEINFIELNSLDGGMENPIQIQIENDYSTGMGDDPAPYHFTIEQFNKDYINLVKLYWYSNDTFRTKDNIKEKELKKDNDLDEKLFKIEDENKIDTERLLILVKRDFGLDNSSRDATNKEKIYQKLFYISYICNELISDLCGKINQKDFKYSSIYNFYYIVSLSFNQAIKGFLEIIKEINKSNNLDSDSNNEDIDAPLLK